jgi:hypothetical protein
MNVVNSATSDTATHRAWVFGKPLSLWAPVLLLESYLAFTVFLFFFGPVDWNIPSVAKLLFFLMVNYGALLLGYRWGLRRGRASIRHGLPRFAGVIRVESWLLRLILVSMAFTIVSTLARLLVIRGGLGEVIATIASPGEAYVQAQLIAQMDRDGMVMPIQSYSWIFRISTVLAVLNGLYLPLSVACWRRLPRSHKSLFWVAVFCSLLYAVGIGAQAGVGFMLFSIIPVILYKVLIERTPIRLARRDKFVASRSRSTGRIAFLALVSTLLLIVTVAFFQTDRAERSGYEVASGDALVGTFGTPNSRGFPLFEDERLGFGVVMACKYVSHGYEGLALAMELPFEWTYGLGWSKGLQVVLRDYLGGPDLFERSYLSRNEATNGWPALWWWSTIFPWIASDTTFLGTVLVMLLVGFWLARLWMETIINGNLLGFAVLGQLFILVFMFPANNALAQTLDAVFSLTGYLVVYFIGTSWLRHAEARRRRAPAQ